MLHFLFKIRFLLSPMAVLFAVLAMASANRLPFVGLLLVVVLGHFYYYSSDVARIVYWLQGYRRLCQAHPDAPGQEVRRMLADEFLVNPKNAAKATFGENALSSLDSLITEIISVEFRYHILNLASYTEKLWQTMERVDLYASELGIDTSEENA